MTAGFERELPNGKKDFYARNLSKAINVFGDGIMLSGDLAYSDEMRGEITLKNFLDKRYKSNGDPEFWENPGEFVVSTLKLWGKSESTKEERFGKIVNSNKELMLQELEQQKKLSGFLGEPLIVVPSVYRVRE